MQDSVTVDVLIATDLRLPGGTTASVAEEITALARAGYRVALAQVFGPMVAKPRAFAPAILERLTHGEAELLHARDRAEARLAILRHPGVFASTPVPFPTITSDHVVMVANQVVTTTEGIPFYDVKQVDRVVQALFGREPVWAPIGPLVRSGLVQTGVSLAEEDWVNVIDIDDWAVERPGPRGSVPVIGRHSRPHPYKWPASRNSLLAAYPADGSIDVRILGGAEPAGKILGRVPKAWRVEPFGSRHPRDFLADLDFVVYYHDPSWREAFGRTVLEGLASGAVCVVDPALRPTFGDAVVYATPTEAVETVRRLHGSLGQWREQAERGQAWVRARYGHETHVRRVGELIGPPQSVGAIRADRRPDVGRLARHLRRKRDRRTVLFVSSNGAGMGHLTRLLAMARRAGDGVRPLFLSVSSAVSVVGSYGYAYEYFPSRATLGIPTAEWNVLFERRVRQSLGVHRPAALVFDGTWPYQGLIAARSASPGTVYVWSRRAMWREGTAAGHLGLASHFDLVIEPGEFAASADRGPTTRRSDARRVRPITLLDDDELLSREEAAKTLGLDAESPAALVTLGAGNINDISAQLSNISSMLLEIPNLQVVTTRPLITVRSQSVADRVRQVSHYPLTRCLRTIDLAFSAAGYNSFHEQIAFAVPTAFVPNRQTQTDDQDARARYAAETGTGLYLPRPAGPMLADAVRVLADADARHEISVRCQDLYPGNGAAEAMAAVEEHVGVDGGGGT